MTSSTFLLPLLLLLLSSVYPSAPLLLPISKHPSTPHYLIQTLPPLPLPSPLLLSLSSPSLFLSHCPPSLSPLPSLSLPCSSAPQHLPPSPSSPCTLPSQNPLSLLSSPSHLFSTTPHHFLFVCSPNSLSPGLPSAALGVFGLSQSSPISPLSQLSHLLHLPLKFSLCLPSTQHNTTGGFLVAGKSLSKSLLYTPLIDSDRGSPDDYFIGVRSIKVAGSKIPLPAPTISAKLSTVVPLTKMGSGVYNSFVRAFQLAMATTTNESIPAVAPFGVCYRGRGPFPAVELVLQSEMVRWRVDMAVEVGEGVVCLGVVEGGAEEMGEGEMVIGAGLLEDVLVEFDLRSGMFGFSGSLAELGTSCDELRRLDASGLSLDM